MDKAKTFEPSRAWRILVFLAVGATVLGLDRITKSVVRSTIAVTGENVPVIPEILSFRFVANIGAAFSMGEGMGDMFALFAAIVVCAIAVYLCRAPRVSRVETFGLALMAGGAIGNAVDRVLLGYVVDFIATDFISFPVFNVADIGITCGVVLAFIGFMFLSPATRDDAGAERDGQASDSEDAR